MHRRCQWTHGEAAANQRFNSSVCATAPSYAAVNTVSENPVEAVGLGRRPRDRRLHPRRPAVPDRRHSRPRAEKVSARRRCARNPLVHADEQAGLRRGRAARTRSVCVREPGGQASGAVARSHAGGSETKLQQSATRCRRESLLSSAAAVRGCGFHRLRHDVQLPTRRFRNKCPLCLGRGRHDCGSWRRRRPTKLRVGFQTVACHIRRSAR